MNPFDEARQWCRRSYAGGWIDDDARGNFEGLERSGAAELFDKPARPLVVGLFGGTGVGKSSLLNRLSGESVARVGVERPTSRELVLYAHVSAPLGSLPAELPADCLQIRRHENERWREVVWIDAPDIDSVSTENRDASLAWLPHIDLLIYVVSPERYRDDVGWRVLARRSERHGWIFVMNRWDEGALAQENDLRDLLAAAGFADALVFCTSCRQSRAGVRLPSADEFSELETSVESLLDEHAVRELDRLGRHGRLRALAEALESACDRIGGDELWRTARADWRANWRRTEKELRDGLEWPIRALAARFASPGATLVDPRSATADVAIGPGLWDEWAVERIGVALDEYELVVRRSGLAAGRIRSDLESVAESARALSDQYARRALRAGLARPGSLLRRALRKGVRLLLAALPVAAMLWVGSTVVTRYYRAGIGEASYLDTNFAVHSALLVLVAWAVPYGLDRLLRPAMEQVAVRALRRGMGAAIAELGARLSEVQMQTAAEGERLRKEAAVILQAIHGRQKDAVLVEPGGVLDRALAKGDGDR